MLIYEICKNPGIDNYYKSIDSNYNIILNDILNPIIMEGGEKITITIKDLTGKDFKVTIASSATVLDLKKENCKECGV